MPNLHVMSEVVDGEFSIGGGAKGKQVSWQLHVADQKSLVAPGPQHSPQLKPKKA